MQEQKQKQASPQRQETSTEVESKSRTPETQELLDDGTSLLDEIDELLAGLDADLAEKFVQKGGE